MNILFGGDARRKNIHSSPNVFLARFAVLLLISLVAVHITSASANSDLLDHSNLVPWEVRWDQGGIEIEPDAQAKILKAKGIRRYAIGYSADSAAHIEAQIAEYQRHGIEILAAYFWLGTDRPGEDPKLRAAFDSFKRLKIRPQIWVSQSDSFLPATADGWRQRFAELGFEAPTSNYFLSAFSSDSDWTEQAKERFFVALHRMYSDEDNLPKTPQEQLQRLERETSRVASLAQLAARYGLEVGLYNHNGWFGLMDNQLAIIERLEREGIKNVGIVYTFWHARDSLHDDVENFKRIWPRIKPNVLTVAISGVRGEMEGLYPSEGDDELKMMRIVQSSGWRGPVGVLCLDFAVDPDNVLRMALLGTDWVAAELKRPGSGGTRPLFRERDLGPGE